MGNQKKNALRVGPRITVVLLKKPLVSISYATFPVASSTRVVLNGEFLSKTSFIAASTFVSLQSVEDTSRTEVSRLVVVQGEVVLIPLLN